MSGGSGHLVVLKNAPHPNATRVFVNWFLSREGQEVYTRAMHQATRRLDVDVKWLREVGVIAAKDALTDRAVLQTGKINRKTRSTVCASRRPRWRENFSVRRILP